MAKDTPRSSLSAPRIKPYTEAEKATILENFDLEIESRCRKFKTRLEEDVSDFGARHKQLLSSIPRAIWSMSVEEFSTKYDGSVKNFLEAATRTKIIEGVEVDIPESPRKRKAAADAGPSKSSKSARTDQLRQTRTGEGDATPKATRAPMFDRGGASPSKTGTALPSRLRDEAGPSGSHSSTRPPASNEFNPDISQTPAYPLIDRSNTSSESSTSSSTTTSSSTSFSFSLTTRTGATLHLNPDQSPSGALASLTNSAKKDVQRSILKLAQRYGRMEV